MRRLYDERPRFCDVAIECIPARRPEEDGNEDGAPVQNVVYAHRAILAARTQYDSCLLQFFAAACFDAEVHPPVRLLEAMLNAPVLSAHRLTHNHVYSLINNIDR